MDSRNKSIEELEKTLKSVVEAFRRMAARGRPGLNIPRVFANVNDDTDLDDALTSKPVPVTGLHETPIAS